MFSEHLNDSQRHVRRRNAGLEVSNQSHSDHVGRQHVDRLTEHDGFCLNATDTPAQNAQTVDHRGVRIRSNQRISEPNAFFLACHAGQEFEVHLMDNASGRRHSLEVCEGLLTPFEEGVALHVSVVFNVEVHVQSVATSARNVNLNRVVNHQVDGNLRVHLFWVAAHLHHGVAKGRQINHGGDASKVLQNDTRRTEGDFPPLSVGCPSSDGANVLLRDEETVIATQGTFQQNANGIREVSGWDAVGIKGVQ